MRKTLYTLLLAVAASLIACTYAEAAPLCKPVKPTDVRVGVTLNTDATVAGAWAYWFCVTDVDVQIEWRAAPASAFTSSLIGQLNAYRTGADPTAVDAVPTLASNAPAIAAMRADAFKAAAADPLKPAMPTWKVSKNGTATDRPAYSYVGGVMGATSTSRVPVGADCDCKAQKLILSENSSYTYCQTAPKWIAACTRSGPAVSK